MFARIYVCEDIPVRQTDAFWIGGRARGEDYLGYIGRSDITRTDWLSRVIRDFVGESIEREFGRLESVAFDAAAVEQ
jgi:hypothetical protein